VAPAESQNTEPGTTGGGDTGGTTGSTAGSTTGSTTAGGSTSGSTGAIGADPVCEAQWVEHLKYFTKDRKLSYKSSLSTLGQTFPITHEELILESSDAQVSRRVSISSTNSTASQLIGSIKIPDPIVVTKSAFISSCSSSKGVSQPTVAIGVNSLTLKETRAENVQINGASFAATYFLFEGTVEASGSAVAVSAKVWGSAKRPGLILKQNIDLNNMPIVTKAIITDEYTAPE
jgi:hypothetical protein